MKLIKTELDDVYIVEPKVFGDHRGWFMESYSRIKFDSLNITFAEKVILINKNGKSNSLPL